MVKNFSSHESVLFVANAITISPIDVTLGFAFACLLVRRIAFQTPLVKGALLSPAHGLHRIRHARSHVRHRAGGDTRVAVFEVRPFFYLPIVYVLTTNYCHTATHYRRMLWTAMVAVFGQLAAVAELLLPAQPGREASLESLGEHGSAVGMNTLFVLLIASFSFVDRRSRGRWLLAHGACRSAGSTSLSNRRAAVVGLLAGIAFLSVIVFWRQPRTFFKFVPVMAVLVLAYLGAFWNSDVRSGVSCPSRQVGHLPEHVEQERPQLRPLPADREQRPQLHHPSDEGARSRLRQHLLPALPAPRPGHHASRSATTSAQLGPVDLAADRIPGIRLDAVRARARPDGRCIEDPAPADGPDVAMVSTGAIFIAMYSVFAYVDIAWDARNMLLLGVALAMSANFPVPAVVAPPSNAYGAAEDVDVAAASRLLAESVLELSCIDDHGGDAVGVHGDVGVGHHPAASRLPEALCLVGCHRAATRIALRNAATSAGRHVHARLAVDDHVGLARRLGAHHGPRHRHGFEDRRDPGLEVGLQQRHDDESSVGVQLTELEQTELAHGDVAGTASPKPLVRFDQGLAAAIATSTSSPPASTSVS